MMKSRILGALNPQQEKAVKHVAGPLFILAGAGTGKTRVITHRIAYLIQEMNVRPFNILALTFTNKAAAEMKERVAVLSGEDASGALVCTFHSFCNYVLRRDIENLASYRKGFSIYDETDSRNCIKSILKQLDLSAERDFSPAAISSIISKSKNFDIPPTNYVPMHMPLYDIIEEVAERYAKTLEHNNALDFDDLLIKALELFRNHDHVRENYRSRFRYILVDEYQDTNLPQYELVKCLCAPSGNITVVGDLDQSIYGWRGANADNMYSFERDFSNVQFITLEQNYRSKQGILDAANELITHNQGIGEKKLWSDLGEGENPFHFTPWDDREEAEFICMEIEHLLMEGYRLSDIAVMFRTKAQTRVFEETFLRSSIQYVLIGATAFYQRKEIKDIIAYLRVLENPRDIEAYSRIANEPRRGVGDKTLEKVIAYAMEVGSLFELLGEDGKPVVDLPKKAVPLLVTLKKLSSMRNEMPLDKLITEMLKETRYMDYLDELAVSEGVDTRKENAGELISLAAEYSQEANEPDLDGFLSRIALVSDTDVQELDTDKVKLITLHSAKGLEFPIVFIAGVEENLLPHKTSMEEDPTVQEERRLCYVGITRAREKLYLSSCRSRFRFGSVMHNAPSRFIMEIGDENLQPMESPGSAAGGSSFFDEEHSTGGFGGGFGGGRTGGAKNTDFDDVFDDDMPSTCGVSPGDYVIHEQYGEGCVVSVSGDEIEISFKGIGVKSFLMEYAPIRKK